MSHLTEIECWWRPILEMLQGPIGLGAAFLWFLAAWNGRKSILGVRLLELDRSFQKQARLNAWAALLTAITALLQVVLFYLPPCRDFG